MPQVRPFRGISYALPRDLPDGTRARDVSDLVCPPYDVISADLRAALLERDPHNAVRLELSAEAEPQMAAARTLAAWLADGTLERRPDPSLYYYRHARLSDPDEPSVQGVLARVLLEPFGAGVRAHEHTMAAPKADRLALLHATRTQLSPILALYFDRSARYDHLMGRAWSDEWRARDADGLLHALSAIEPDDQLSGYLSRQRLYIADGHHRYETALAYQAEVRADPSHARAAAGSLPADWMMIVLVNADREQVEIQATHRLILDADPEQLASLATDPGPLWQVIPVAPADLAGRLEQLGGADEPVIGLLLPGDKGFLLVGDADAVADRMRREQTGSAVRGLDLAVLHTAVLDDRLGIDPAAIAAGGRVAYTRSAVEAQRAVAVGAARAAFLVRPTRLEQIAAVADAGGVMPQKSTYFYPKLLTGLVFNPLED